MTTTPSVQQDVVIDAPASLVFDLLAGLQGWSQFHDRAIHAEPGDNGIVEHWWLVDDHTVRNWRARWEFDRDASLIGCEDESGGRSTWELRTIQDALTEVRATTADSDLADLLPAVADAATHDRERRDLVIDFEDTLFVSGSVTDAYTYLYEANKWPERIPHVSALTLEETVPNIQFFDMDTKTPDGSAHTTRSVRICLPESVIIYKQIHLPKLLTAHTGHWRFTVTREGFVMGARHCAVIKPAALPILGPGTDVLDARRYLRRVLSANSMGNLSLAKAYAEERSGA